MSTQLPNIRIAPGGYFASSSDVVLSTTLGSCVAVCLYDPFNKVVGMNHIMISREDNKAGKLFCYQEDGKYGDCAMELLLHEMLSQGALLKNMLAKVFGGASLLKPYDACTTDYCIGNENVRFALNYLMINSIPIVRKAVGGDQGRVLRFYSSDFSVWVKKIKKGSNPALVRKDKTAWDSLKPKSEV
jgi:chemotaxis protein CheD